MPSKALPSAAVDSLAKRLADDAALRLPASLSGQIQEAAPDRSKRVEYLKALLQQDPGVFLERHGELLDLPDLEAFEPLREDYEVDFFVRQLTEAKQPAPPQLTALVRNRRLAKLNRLIEEGTDEGLFRLSNGEFFSEEAMRARQPLLHYQYVGQYKAAEPAPMRAEGLRDGHPLSASILRDVDEARTLDRFQTQLRTEQDVERESSEEEDSYPEDRRAEMEQISAAAAPSDSAAAADEAAGEAAAATRQSGSGIEAKPPEADAEAENRPEAAPFVRIPEEEQLQLQADFIALMHRRFLDGEDEDYVDYKQIDSCAALDDDWEADRRQDAEDAYFDSVE